MKTEFHKFDVDDFEVTEMCDHTQDSLVLGVELKRVSDVGRSLAFIITHNKETDSYSLEVEYEEDGVGNVLGWFPLEKSVFCALKEGKLLNANS